MKKYFLLIAVIFLLAMGNVHAQETRGAGEKSEKKEKIESLAEILNSFVDHFVIYNVAPDDTLAKIAKAHGTTIEFIKKINKLHNDNIGVGQQLRVWNAPFTIEIDKEENLLYLELDGTAIKEYGVSTGKSNSITPVGEFTIQSRYPNPTWFHKGEVVPGGTPENWLGTRWLGFNIPKYGIHGTIFPEQIGQSVSGGCVRMKNHDVEELYDYIPRGTKVVIKDGETQ